MRFSETLQRTCPYCANQLTHTGYDIGPPLATYLDCEPCDVRWVVEMDELQPKEGFPMIIPVRLSAWPQEPLLRTSP
jgi:hypothetical protein